PTPAEWQLIGPVRHKDMPYIERRWPFVQPEIAQRIVVVRRSLVRQVGQIGERLAPSIVRLQRQPVAEGLPQLDLQAVIGGVGVVVEQRQAAYIGVRTKEVDWVRAGRRVTQIGAG